MFGVLLDATEYMRAGRSAHVYSRNSRNRILLIKRRGNGAAQGLADRSDWMERIGARGRYSSRRSTDGRG